MIEVKLVVNDRLFCAMGFLYPGKDDVDIVTEAFKQAFTQAIEEERGEASKRTIRRGNRGD